MVEEVQAVKQWLLRARVGLIAVSTRSAARGSVVEKTSRGRGEERQRDGNDLGVGSQEGSR